MMPYINKPTERGFLTPISLDPTSILFPERQNLTMKVLTAVGKFADTLISYSDYRIEYYIGINFRWTPLNKPIYTGSPLLITAKKIAKVAAFLLIVPVLIALPIKIAYRSLCVCAHPVLKEKDSDVSSTEKSTGAGLDNVVSKETVESILNNEKTAKPLLTDLPNWIRDHFPAKQHASFENETYKRWYTQDIEKMDAKQITERAKEVVQIMITDLAGHNNKTGYMLRGLTFSKENANVNIIGKHIMQTAWDNEIENYEKKESYLWNKQNIMTMDSKFCLDQALAKFPETKDRYINHPHFKPHTYPFLKMCMEDPFIFIVRP